MEDPRCAHFFEVACGGIFRDVFGRLGCGSGFGISHQGRLGWGDVAGGKTSLQVFTKLRDGDMLQLGDNARLQLVYSRVLVKKHGQAQETLKWP